MSSQSFLDRAANVRDKRKSLQDTLDRVKDGKGEWVGLSMTADEAMDIAENGLRQAWAMLNHIHQLASLELTRTKDKRDTP